MPRVSAGLLMYRVHDELLQVLLAHPGGPYFRNRDDGAWTLPKGEPEPDQELLDAVRIRPPSGTSPSASQEASPAACPRVHKMSTGAGQSHGPNTWARRRCPASPFPRLALRESIDPQPHLS
jgi:hypothetical protein